MSEPSFYIILVASLVAISCSLLGCYLVLRKMAMVGDAISHAVLPGIVIAYLISNTFNSLAMLAGAMALGILSTFLIEFFHRKGNLQTDASIGVTFTWLFAVGVVMLSFYAGEVDLDQECVLYGEIALVPFDTLITSSGQSLGPRALWIISPVLLAILLFIGVGYKGLQLTTFDGAYAALTGVSVLLWHYALMAMVSAVTVASFELVGAILVVAFLIVPPATAYLLTRQLKTMLWLAVIISIACAVGGYYLASWINGSIAGAMATVAGFLFILALIFSPTDGLLTRKLRVGQAD